MQNINSVKKVTFEVFVALENATYQAFINASQDLIAPEDFYNHLDAMRDNVKLRKDRIYIKKVDGMLAYSLIAPDGTTVANVPTSITAPADLFGHNWNQKSAEFKRMIVDLALEAGHIQENIVLYKDPFQGYLDELKGRLPEDDYNEELFTNIYQKAFRVDVGVQTKYHSRVELSYKRSIGTASGSPLQLWIDKDVVIKFLNDFYSSNFHFINYCYDLECFERSKLHAIRSSFSNYSREVYQDGYILAYDAHNESGVKKFKHMELLLETKNIGFRTKNNQPVPFSRFLLDLITTFFSMQVIPVVGFLAIVSLLTIGTAAVGLGVGAIYGVGVLTKPCYQRFFGESPQSKILRQEVAPPSIDIAQLFQEHFETTLEADQNIDTLFKLN